MLVKSHVFAYDFYNKLNNKGRRLLLLSFVCVSVLWASSTAHATPPISGTTTKFSVSDIATTADGGHSVFAADMDNDGDMDILSASFNDDTIAWYENDGAPNPTFTASDIATSADGANAVFAADMDNDGDMDIISASELDDTIAWYENDGAVNPTFTASDIDTSADGANAVFAADMDNDGDIDILSASELDNTIAWYENDGAVDPTFTASDIATSADGANSVFAADMDNDGDIDILSASELDNTIAWYENDGAANPTFTASDIDTSADGANFVFAADMDNDGDMDILSASELDNTIAWYENDGAVDPTFTPSDIATSADGANSVFAADMDNDGDMDILSGSFDDDTIAWYENDGADDPSFTASDIATTADGANAVFVADMDNDGDMDVLSASFNDGTIAWYKNLLLHRNSYFADSGQSLGSATSYDVAMGDIDGDGDLDAFVANGAANKVWTNDGAGVFADSGQSLGSVNSNAVALGDVDGDGDLDAIIANFNQGVEVWTNVGGVFADSGQSLGSAWSVDVALGDVDKDGDLDVFVANSNDPNTVWINNGVGVFADSGQILGSAWSVAVALGDVDEDGDLDAFVTNRYQANKVWTNDGDGAFMDSGQSLGSAWSVDVALGDVDKDGDLDAFVTNRYEANKVWTNDGGIFTESSNSLGTADSSAVALGDVDGDGDLDAVVANDASANKVWINDGAGAFTDGSHSVGGDSDSSGVALGDVDGDGDLEVFISNFDQANKVYINKGGSVKLAVSSTNPSGQHGFQAKTEDDLLRIVFNHNGISGDPDLELNQISLDLLRSNCSTPLTSSEANALMDNLYVRVDDGDGVFETSDTLVANVDTISLTGGVQLITFTNDDSNVQVAATSSKIYWISIFAFADASKQSPNELCLSLDPDADALVEGKGTADFSVPLQDTDATNTGRVFFSDPPTLLEIEATSAENNEGNSGDTAFTFTVTRSGTTSGVSAVNYAVTGSGTYSANATDFGGSYPSGTVNFSASQTSKVITVNVSGDSDVENDETFTVTLSNPTNAVIETATAGGTIQNDDTSVAIAATSASKAEGDSGDTAFTFTVTRSGNKSGASSVNYAVTGSGTNQANAADFGGSLPSGSVNFSANDTSKVITINVNGDTDIEEDETFTVTLSNPSGTGLGTDTADGTIQNDDTEVSIAVTSADKAEGASGNTAFTFTVTRSGYTGGASSVAYAVTGSGTNQADAADFGGSLPSGSVNFATIETSKVITVNVSGDTDVENDETFTVTLSNPSGTAIDTDTADGTIQNDDTNADIGATSANKSEGDSGDIAFTFTVTRTGLTSGASSVAYAVTGSGADPANAADFGGSLPSGSVDFSASETTKEVTVNVSGDTDVEEDETFIVALSNPSGTTIGTSTANGTIQNDDTSVAIAATSANKEEGDSGTTAFTFTITRTGVTSGASSVAYAVTGGGDNPADADDFGGSLPSGTVNFAGSDTIKEITVNVSGDTDIENQETFTVTLSNPTDTTISTATAVGTIQDDDSAIGISESDGNTTSTEGGATDSYTVVLYRQPTADVLVAITPDGQTDLGNGAGISVTLTFTDSNWDEAQTVTVTAVNDDIAEGNHSSTITHSATSDDGIFDGTSINNVTVAITDDDLPAVSIVESASSTAITEDGTTDSYTVVLTSQPTSDVSLQIDPDTQTDLGNGAGAPVTLTFTNGNWDTPQTVTVTAVDDDIAEGSHSSTITHSATSSDGKYNGISVSNVTAAITDNDTAGVELTEFDGNTAVSENGDTDTYDIVLSSKPAATVVVMLIPDSQVEVSRDSFTFTPSDWDKAQTVRVTAVDDSNAEGSHIGNISHSVSSSDTQYNNLSVRNIVVNITDKNFSIFLPTIVNNYTAAPDLVVNEIAVDGSSVTVTIENQGSAPVTEEFWVDLYLNPTAPPTQVNDVWEMSSVYGAAWGVVEPGLLAPGESLALTLNDVYLDSSRTNLPNVISTGSKIYVQVDSANANSSFGGVLETHESYGEPYNNIKSITTTSSLVVYVSEETAVLPHSILLPSR